MTVLEFEAFISDNYRELVAVAKRISRNDGVDALHRLVEEVLERETFPPSDGNQMAWMVRALKLQSIDGYRKEQTELKSMAQAATNMAVLGEESFTDQRLGRKARQARERKGIAPKLDSADDAVLTGKQRIWKRYKKKKTDERIQGLISGLLTGPCGNTRWLSQQRKDAKLFDGEACRSLSDSIRRVSRRYRHFTEFGISYVAFGREEFGPSVAAEAVPWTQVVGGATRPRRGSMQVGEFNGSWDNLVRTLEDHS